MNQIHLAYGDTKATIDPHGAWLTALSDEKGDILYPRHRIIDTKGVSYIRGGCHVCVPNFGPDTINGQPQHGFGRHSEWKIVGDDTDYASLILLSGTGMYEDVSTMLSVELDDHAVTMTLSTINKGKEPILIAPGFQPYFSGQKTHAITLDDESVDLDSLGVMRFVSGPSHDIKIGKRFITVESDQLPQWGVWTDQIDDYVVVAPTRSGYAFVRRENHHDDMLGSREQRTYTMRISW